jgi:hypothetical protein
MLLPVMAAPPERNPPWYTPSYCEENVWWLCREPVFQGTPACAVFISNPGRVCPTWHQRSAPDPALPVPWDYHVVLAAEATGGAWGVWDLDTTLPWPCPLAAYLAGSFPGGVRLPEPLRPWFRVVERSVFVAAFASDRSHMVRPDGTWVAPPPAWAPILPPGVAPCLDRLVDVTRPFLGRVGRLGDVERMLGEETRGVG